MGTEVKETTEALPEFMKKLPNLKQDAKNLLQLARLAEQAERYEEMCAAMDSLVKLKAKDEQNLELEERNMLSVAYKNAVGQRRAAWRSLQQTAEQNDTSNYPNQDLVSDYITFIEGEMENKCNGIVNLVTNSLLIEGYEHEGSDDANMTECQVFYLKMCGDYFRYLAEFKKNDDTVKTKAKENYKAALKLARAGLPPTHPTRLGLALNASVCYYEILENQKEACALAKSAFDQAIQKLDALSDSTYKDSTLIMQLLRDNLTLWNASDEKNQTEVADD